MKFHVLAFISKILAGVSTPNEQLSSALEPWADETGHFLVEIDTDKHTITVLPRDAEVCARQLIPGGVLHDDN